VNLYLISQSENSDYDTYDSAVVAAETEELARNTRPNGEINRPSENWPTDYSWTSPENVRVELIGKAKEGTEVGVICFSFNAG
jgi:hypothetical protein